MILCVYKSQPLFTNDNKVCRKPSRSAHLALDNFRVWTLEFLDDIKALVEVREDVSHGTREHSVLKMLSETVNNTNTRPATGSKPYIPAPMSVIMQF